MFFGQALANITEVHEREFKKRQFSETLVDLTSTQVSELFLLAALKITPARKTSTIFFQDPDQKLAEWYYAEIMVLI